jgi:Transcriptional regulator/sugar kinase
MNDSQNGSSFRGDEMKGYIGVDLGGTKISGILLDASGEKLAAALVPTKAEAGRDTVEKQLFLLIDQIIEKAQEKKMDVIGIGVGVPGAVEQATGVLVYAANLPLRKYPFVEILKARYALPIILENDAAAAAWAEYKFGSGQGSNTMLFVTASTGIGAGAVINGALYTGSTGSAFELGHITIKKDGLACGCGNRGCAELYASGSALARIAKEKIACGEMTALKGQKITAEAVFMAAAAGDRLSEAIVKQALEDLGTCVSVAAALLDPDIIVIGGGMSQAGDRVWRVVEAALKEKCLPTVAEHVKVVPSALKSEAGVYGAAALFMKK